MNEYEEMVMEDMIEIENIKQELQIKEEIELPRSEQCDYLSNDELSNDEFPETHDSWIKDNELKNNNHDQSILRQNPFSNIKISNISYTSNSKNISTIPELPEPNGLFENEIDRIIFRCETCNGVIRNHINADHTYAIRHNRLREVVEEEEKKDSSDRVYKCAFCAHSLENPQKYLLHLQTHELEITRCRSCNEQLKLSDSLSAHIIIKFRSCGICRQLFTHAKGYRQHLHSHDVIAKKPDTCMENEEILEKKENNENEIFFAEETENFLKTNKFSETEHDIERIEKKPEFSTENVITTRNLDSELIVPEKETEKVRRLQKTEEIAGNNERNEAPESTSSNRLSQVSQEEVSEEKSQSHFLEMPISIEDSMKDVTTLTETEKVIYLFECKGCSRNFVSRKAILEHVTGKHVEEYRMWDSLYKVKKLVDKKPTLTKDGRYICRFCPSKFDSVSVYMTHLNEHHLCIHCDKIFQNKEILEDHKHQLQESLVCRICNLSFVLKNNFLIHLKSHDNECTICQEQFTSESMLLIHKKVMHPEGICYICHKWFSSKVILNKHKLMMHNVSLESFSCWLCSRKYKSEDSFRIHMGTHGEKRPFSCPHCGKFYARYRPMTTHSEKCDFFDVRKIFECAVCKIAFYDGKKYVTHMKEHLENYKIQMTNTHYLKELETLKDNEDPKKIENPKNRTNKKTLMNQKNIKLLPFASKIIWRESSFPKMNGNKLDRERQRKRQKREESENIKSFVKKCQTPKKKSRYASERKSADVTSTKNGEEQKIQDIIISTRNLWEKTKREMDLDQKVTSNQSGQKLEFRKNLPNLLEGINLQPFKFQTTEKDPLKNEDTQQNLLFVVKKRQGGKISQGNSVEKVLLLKPISQGILKKKVKKVVKIKSSQSSTYPVVESQNKLIVTLASKNKKDTLNEIFTLSSENDESDPLALENLSIVSENQMETSSSEIFESDPLALESPPTISAIEMETSSEISEFDPQSLVNGDLDIDSEEKIDFATEKKSFSETKNAPKQEIELKVDPKKIKSKSKNAKSEKNTKNNEDFFFCSICKKRILLMSWNDHRKTHKEGLKMFKCRTCYNKFSTYAGLARHEKSHRKH